MFFSSKGLNVIISPQALLCSCQKDQVTAPYEQAQWVSVCVLCSSVSMRVSAECTRQTELPSAYVYITNLAASMSQWHDEPRGSLKIMSLYLFLPYLIFTLIFILFYPQPILILVIILSISYYFPYPRLIFTLSLFLWLSLSSFLSISYSSPYLYAYLYLILVFILILFNLSSYSSFFLYPYLEIVKGV